MVTRNRHKGESGISSLLTNRKPIGMHPAKTNLPLLGLLCIAAVALYYAPPETDNAIRSAVCDAALPGQLVTRNVIQRVDATLDNWKRPTIEELGADSKLSAQLEALEHQARQLQLDNALLRDRLKTSEQSRVSPYWVTGTEPLIVPELLQAAVLGSESGSDAQSGLLIDVAGQEGIIESSLVLEDTTRLIDQGADVGLETGLPVYAGCRVVGKIARAGRYVSTVQRITDAGYAGLAQLARHTPDGFVLGAQGVLEGRDEPFCRLKRISSTVHVSKGDDVFTVENDGTLAYPMYYGKVVKVESTPEGLDWEIWVEPAINGAELKHVQVLRKSINPVRQLAE